MTNATVPTRRPYLALAALALPMVLVAIDIAVLQVALPEMGRDLHASATELLWMTDSYNFLVAGAMLTAGALADRIGRRRMILISAAVFAVASAVGAFATTPELVIVARGAMGLAGASVMPASMALLGVMFTEEKARIQAMGATMTVFLVGMAVAPFVGGLLLAHFWWGSVFLLGVPVMVVTLIVVPRLVPESRAEHPAPLDLVSAGLSLVGIMLVVYALKAGINSGMDAGVVAAGVVGLGVLAAFVRRQRTLEFPLVDLGLLARPQVRRTMTALFLIALLMGGSSIFFNLYLQEVRGLSPLHAAVWMAPQMIAMIAASNVGPLLNRRFPQRAVLATMMGLMTAGFAIYAVLPSSGGGLPLLSLGAACATFGIGACFPMLMDSIMSSAPPERAGAGAAMAQLSNELGIALGLTLLGSLGTIVYRASLGHPGSPARDNVVTGLQWAEHTGDTALADAVRSAFTDSFHVVGLVGVLVMLVVMRQLSARRRNDVQVISAPAPETVAVAAGSEAA